MPGIAAMAGSSFAIASFVACSSASVTTTSKSSPTPVGYFAFEQVDRLDAVERVREDEKSPCAEMQPDHRQREHDQQADRSTRRR